MRVNYRLNVTTRVYLTPPLGEPVVRDIVDGRWAEITDQPSMSVGQGLWALPGLVDAHSHLAAAELDYQPGDLVGAIGRAKEALIGGVTLLLDKGWRDDTTIRLIDTVPEGRRPDIEAAAVLIATRDGYYPGFAREVEASTLEAEVVVAAGEGRGWVKLVGDWPRRGLGPVANFTESELKAAVETAGAHGAKVAIHTMARETPSRAVRAGVHSIEHGLFLTDTDIELLGSRSGMWVPTLLRIEAVIAQLGESSSGGQLLLEGLANVRRLLGPALEAGVHVLAGTDLVGSPADIADEALKLLEYGLSPSQAVQAVSIAPRLALGRPASFDPGSPADAVLYPENPVRNPGVLRHPTIVIRQGQLI
jgi:imidazolonepropionase-like amidohydrolase